MGGNYVHMLFFQPDTFDYSFARMAPVGPVIILFFHMFINMKLPMHACAAGVMHSFWCPGIAMSRYIVMSILKKFTQLLGKK